MEEKRECPEGWTGAIMCDFHHERVEVEANEQWYLMCDKEHTYCQDCATYYETEEDEEAEDDVEEAGDDVEKPLVGADHLGEIEMADRHSNDEEEH